MQAKFLTKLKTELVRPGWWKKKVKLTAPLKYYSALAGQVIVVPRWFICDLASVPRLPVVYWLFGATQDAPAAVHDFLYKTGLFPRRKSDLIFLEAMQAMQNETPLMESKILHIPQKGMRLIHRYGMYAGVRAGGWYSYYWRHGHG